jgi:hypothetical protein
MDVRAHRVLWSPGGPANRACRNILVQSANGGTETRGVVDHGFIHSVYFRDPNTYVIELSARHAQAMDPATNGARAELDRWQAEKAPQAAKLAAPPDSALPPATLRPAFDSLGRPFRLERVKGIEPSS